MKVIVNSRNLHQKLQLIQNVVPKNPMLPILECFLFDIKDNTLSMTASDLHITSTTSMPIEKAEEGRIAIPATILMDILSKLPDQALTLSVNSETYTTKIVSENGNYQISSENPADFPQAPAIEGPTEVQLPANVLREALNQTAYAMSTDELRPALNGLYAQINESITFVATDGHRLAKYTNTGYSSEVAQSIIIPKKTVQTIRGLLGSSTDNNNDNVRLTFNPSNALFELSEVRLSSRLVDERFPDYQNVIPTEHVSTLTLNKDEFRHTVERINIFTNRATAQMRIKIAGNKLELLAEDLDYSNEAKELLICENYTGEDVEIGFNARFLIDVAKTLNGEKIEMRLSRASEAAIIVPADQKEEQALALVMPIMLS